MPLESIAVKHFVVFLMVFARVGGIFTSAPVFGNKHVSIPIKAAMSLAISFVLLPFAVAGTNELPADLLPLAAAVIKEAIVGILIGFVVLLLFTAIQVAAEIVDMQMGFGFANILDPMMNVNASVIAQFQGLLATLIFLLSNAHHLMIKGLADSFNILPCGEMSIGNVVIGGFLALFSQLFITALKIGGPIVGVILLTEIALGILARTVPQLNILVLGFPVKILVGMITVMLVVPIVYVVIQSLFTGIYNDIMALVRGLGGA